MAATITGKVAHDKLAKEVLIPLHNVAKSNLIKFLMELGPEQQNAIRTMQFPKMTPILLEEYMEQMSKEGPS
jgi:hypothetical protein